MLDWPKTKQTNVLAEFGYLCKDRGLAVGSLTFVDDTLAGGAVKITTDNPGFFLRALGITGCDSFMEVTD